MAEGEGEPVTFYADADPEDFEERVADEALPGDVIVFGPSRAEWTSRPDVPREWPTYWDRKAGHVPDEASPYAQRVEPGETVPDTSALWGILWGRR